MQVSSERAFGGGHPDGDSMSTLAGEVHDPASTIPKLRARSAPSCRHVLSAIVGVNTTIFLCDIAQY